MRGSAPKNSPKSPALFWNPRTINGFQFFFFPFSPINSLQRLPLKTAIWGGKKKKKTAQNPKQRFFSYPSLTWSVTSYFTPTKAQILKFGGFFPPDVAGGKRGRYWKFKKTHPPFLFPSPLFFSFLSNPRIGCLFYYPCQNYFSQKGGRPIRSWF